MLLKRTSSFRFLIQSKEEFLKDPLFVPGETIQEDGGPRYCISNLERSISNLEHSISNLEHRIASGSELLEEQLARLEQLRTWDRATRVARKGVQGDVEKTREHINELNAALQKHNNELDAALQKRKARIDQMVAEELFCRLDRKMKWGWELVERFRTQDPRVLDRNNLPFRPESTTNIWIFQDSCFQSDKHYPLEPRQALALILEKENKARLQVDKAMALLAMRENLDKRGRRQRIPNEIKTLVWQRDGGRCVECGSQEELEFDHIIPVSMGGSNTYRNLQLLCSPCNKRKGGTLG